MLCNFYYANVFTLWNPLPRQKLRFNPKAIFKLYITAGPVKPYISFSLTTQIWFKVVEYQVYGSGLSHAGINLSSECREWKYDEGPVPQRRYIRCDSTFNEE